MNKYIIKPTAEDKEFERKAVRVLGVISFVVITVMFSPALFDALFGWLL